MTHSPLSRFTITVQLTPTATLNVSMIKVKKHFWKNERKPECNKNSFHGFGRLALLLTSHEGRHCRFTCVHQVLGRLSSSNKKNRFSVMIYK